MKEGNNACKDEYDLRAGANEIPEVKPSVHAELLLLGNMMQAPDLVKAYEGVLSKVDFADAYAQELFCFLQEYAKWYPDEEVCQEHFNALLVSLLNENVKFRHITKRTGWKDALMVKKLGCVSDPDSEAYKAVKKYSILRNMENSGYDVDGILNRPDFRELEIEELQRLIAEDVEERLEFQRLRKCEDFGSGMTQRALRFFDAPEIGYQTPFSFINYHLHGLYKNDLTLIGGLSNTGKGRFLMTMLVWLVVHEDQTVCLLSNEMNSDDFFKCLLCTLVNNQDLHGKKLRLTQSDIVQSRFKDAEGQYIERLQDEGAEEFRARVQSNSPEYREYLALLQWWDERFAGKFQFVQVADDYSSARLKKEIQMAKAKGCTVIAYDTLKAYQSSEWEALVQATTDLSELIKTDADGLVGIATFQLTEEALNTPPENLSQNQISRAKGIFHLADNMLMFKPLKKEEKYAYEVWSETLSEEYGEPVVVPIGEEQNVVAFRIVKNRRGGGKTETYAVQTNLDRNLWIHVGELQRKKKWAA